MPQSRQPEQFGATLRRLRLAAGLSLAGLSQRVHYSKSHLSKVETGKRGPSLDLARRCDTALRSGGTLTALMPPVDRAAEPPPQRGFSTDRWTVTMDQSGRGAFSAELRRGAERMGTISPLTWSLPDIALPGGHGQDELAAFWSVLREMSRLGQAFAPGVLLPVLVTQTNALRLVALASSSAARREAMALTSRFAEFTGWLAQEAGDDQGAMWWTERAVEFATAGGDRELAAYALIRRGLIALYRYDARETIAVAARAQRARCGDRVRGLAALREAQGHALAGDHEQCLGAIDRGAAMLTAAAVESDRRVPLGSTNVPDPVAMVTGWCLHDLGQSSDAARILERELANVPTHSYRTAARIGARYSLALLGSGELPQACAVAERVLDAALRVDSATVRVDLRRLAQDLNRQSAHRAVKNVMPRLLTALNIRYR